MLFWFGRKVQVKAVPGGRREKGICAHCNQSAHFQECIVTKTWTAYSVLDLSDSQERVFRCSECTELLKLEEKPAAPMDPAIRAKLVELQERKAKLERVLRSKEETAAKAQTRRRANVELSELKRKMGLE